MFRVVKHAWMYRVTIVSGYFAVIISGALVFPPWLWLFVVIGLAVAFNYWFIYFWHYQDSIDKRAVLATLRKGKALVMKDGDYIAFKVGPIFLKLDEEGYHGIGSCERIIFAVSFWSSIRKIDKEIESRLREIKSELDRGIQRFKQEKKYGFVEIERE